jgi:Sensors of blue-light using FAD
LFSLIYISAAARLIDHSELLRLVERCNENNAAADVTGLLLHREGNFIQVLEGAEEAVKRTLSIIGTDARHRGLITLLSDRLPDRQFPGWPLGFVDCDSLRPQANFDAMASRVASFFGPAFDGHPTRAQKLLLNFSKS